MGLKSKTKEILPKTIRGIILKLYHLPQKRREDFMIYRIGKKHKKALALIKTKDKIKVAFFLIHRSVWKYDLLYKMMEADDRFEPMVVICPYVAYGKETMLSEMGFSFRMIESKGYRVIKTYDERNGQWLDVKKVIHPDIVFFTNPHQLTRDEYYINHWQDVLTCYVPYGFMLANIEKLQYDQLFHNLVWKCFYETTIHQEMAKKFARNKGSNTLVTGYPMCDIFLDKNYHASTVWKNQESGVKKIIWAPHHTIEENAEELAYSNFLKDAGFMRDLASQYNGRIQIAFKPHPILKPRLYMHPDWGKEKTDLYFSSWQSLPNGQLEEGNYIDLFLSSDAMIFDSISFMSEYLYTGKPSLFLVRDESVKNKFNEYGLRVFDLLYKSWKNEEVVRFIEEVVLGGADPCFGSRKAFLEQYLIPPNGMTANENIYRYLNNEIA